MLPHLEQSLHTQWRRYRKRLKQCQGHFSETAVHDSRVETRRLLATFELLSAFIPERDLRKARRSLKDHLDSFAQLRDTQVQLGYVEQLVRGFPRARTFRGWLQEREQRFVRETQKAVKKIRTRRLGKRLATFERDLRRREKNSLQSGRSR